MELFMGAVRNLIYIAIIVCGLIWILYMMHGIDNVDRDGFNDKDDSNDDEDYFDGFRFT